MSHLLRCAFAALLVSTPGVWASEAQFPPVLTPIAESETLPAGGVFETVGLRLGMTRDEAIATLTSLGRGKQPEKETATVRLHDDRGNEFEFRVTPGLSARVAQPDSTDEDFQINFTTNINETRIISIQREIRYSNGGAKIADFIAALSGKYGEPSVSTNAIVNSTRWIDLYWIWFKGKKQTLREDAFLSQRSDDGTASSCTFLVTPSYSFGATPSDPSCNAIIKVTIFLGLRDDLMDTVKMEFDDYTRANRNMHDTDAWAEAELQKVTGGQVGVDAPKL